MPYKWIEKLEESNSRLHKEDVIKQALAMTALGDEDAKSFMMYSYYALSPYEIFGVKKVPESKSTCETDDWSMFFQLLLDLSQRALTGHAARDRILEVMGHMTAKAWNTLARRVLIKDLRCGTSHSTFNKILKGTKYEIPIFEAQLAQDGKGQPKKLTGRKRLEVKLDGVRVLALMLNTPEGPTATILSRNGKPLDNFKRIEKALVELIWPRLLREFGALEEGERGIYIDGEVMSASFQELMKHARRKNKKADTEDCVFHVFDLIPSDGMRRGYWNMPQWKRLKILGRILPASFDCPVLKLMPGIDVELDTEYGQQVMKKFNNDADAGGFEGIMVKDPESPYVCGRPDHWLKLKPTITVDLVAKAVEEGTGKHEGRMGAILFEGVDDGREISVSCGSGYSDKDRQEIWDIRDKIPGMIGEIEADAITQNQNGTYSLRFPRFKRWRGFTPGEKL